MIETILAWGVWAYFVLAIAVLGLIFWLWMLADCISYMRWKRGKLAWILIIIIAGFVGALLYFVLAYSQRRKR